MNNPEQKFSAWLRSKLPGHVVRIENCIGAGIPDISWASSEYGEIWIETKISHKGETLLEKEQYAWGMRRVQCGGKIIVLVLDPEYYDGPRVFGYSFPLSIERKGKYLRITSGSNFGVIKSKFNCDLLKQYTRLGY